jgi:D-aminoacyl-tRNA deacylase
MNLIISSEADTASINLRDRLLEMSEWNDDGEFDNRTIWELVNDSGDFCKKGTRLITIEELHIHAEGIDKKWINQTNLDIENIVFLSRHKAASGRPSLTVHPIGNWGAADYGGKKGEISGVTPEWMTGLLLNIRKNRIPGYDVCFEATHHGPLLETPTMFLEIGSSESEWEMKEPAEALIKSLLELEPATGVNVIGIGGGHYTPRFTEAAFSHEVCFGHMVANYGVSVLNPELVTTAISRSKAEGIYFHRKGMKKSEYRKWRNWAEDNNVKVFSQVDYKKRNL